MSGPTIDVKSLDLALEPKKYPYTLTNRFRFDSPGTYTVRLSMTVGLDDDTNQLQRKQPATVERHAVSTTAEIVLQITPAGDGWKMNIIQQGVAAWTAPLPAYTNPPTPQYLNRQQQEDALCNLGTSEAVVALVGLLSRGINVTNCLTKNSNKEVAQAEMRRLLADPDVGVSAAFFAAYAKSLTPRPEKPDGMSAVTPKVVNDVRDMLFASLPKKTAEAMIVSLQTVLRNPMYGYWVVPGSAYDLGDPYSKEVIALTAANFDRLSVETRTALLDTDWEHVRSPVMLPVVRRTAEAGDGHALLRWLELDPVAGMAFVRQEVIRPVPRFSAIYLRLPDASLPGEEQQITANFVAGNAPDELIRSATLLHRYATLATLPTALPFIDQHLAEWPCELQIPVLAYLLKTSPDEARVRLERIIHQVRPPYCPKGEFFSSLGSLEASPVLDALAVRQLEAGTPLAADAAEYLRRFGSAAMKPLVWEQLSRWHTKYAESGAALRMSGANNSPDDWQLYNLDSRLRDAYVKAQGWVLSHEDEARLSKLLGEKTKDGIACTFSCGSQLSVGPAPGAYYIYGRVNGPAFPVDARVDYLMPTELFYYSINQYQCTALKALEQKLLEFPAGSVFSVAHTGDLHDGKGDWKTISIFLKTHGYSFNE